MTEKVEELELTGVSKKSRLVAFLLAFFLGGFGLHRFYVRKIGSGLAQLLFTITIIGALITGIWVIIDMIFILLGGFSDSKGKLLKNW